MHGAVDADGWYWVRFLQDLRDMRCEAVAAIGAARTREGVHFAAGILRALQLGPPWVQPRFQVFA